MSTVDHTARALALLDHATRCTHGLSTRSTEVTLAHGHALTALAHEAQTANLLALLPHLANRPEDAGVYAQVLARVTARLDVTPEPPR